MDKYVVEELTGYMVPEDHFCFQFRGSIPSVNHIYGTGKGGRRFLYPEVKAFRQAIGILALQGMQKYKFLRVPKKFAVEVLIEATVSNAARDVDNIPKAIFDALNGVAFEDDKQVQYFSVRKVIRAGEDELFIIIHESERGHL